MTKSKDSIYSERHRQRRKAQRLPIDLYLDDEFEASIYEKLQAVDNRKQTILKALDEYFKNNSK
ncbi:hypothetical protein [Psychrobacter sp. I-STPA6b]|uniref:hypothetical protein n=1 Tax=Psychrobacter sp. I-STPA6b TaxID=2585718 RepID=UPI001D0C12FB|nr:hypothetical protein [Psychrobacter sp. I-STPA6b]